MIISNIVPIISPYFSSGIAEFWYYPLLGLAILATVPCIIRRLVR